MSIEADRTTGADPAAAARYSRDDFGNDYEQAMRGVR